MIRRHTHTSPHLAPRTSVPTRRPGFTVIEVLVVVSILILLVALLLPAVQRARDVGTRTVNYSQIGEIGSAIGEAKQVLGLPQIPPGPFTLKNKYLGNEPELGILLTAWPQLNTSATGLIPAAQGGKQDSEVILDSNQTLLFFLTGGTVTNFTGFATNPAQPFTVGNPGDNRKGPFLQVSNKYFSTAPSNAGFNLLTTHSVAQLPTSQTNATAKLDAVVVTVGKQTPAHAWLVDTYGMPYAYFAALNGKPSLYCAPPIAPPNKNYPSVTLNTTAAFVQSYSLTFTNGYYSPGEPDAHGHPTLAAPGPLTAYSSNGAYLNPQGFQIISSGKDMVFNYGGTLPPPSLFGTDDQANFTKSVLGGGIN
jgi:type II secretory pathway pseudopilin PulG